MMRKIIVSVAKYARIVCYSCIFPVTTKILEYWYSAWVKSGFNSFGSALIKRPAYVKGGKYISVGNKFNAMQGFRIEAWDSYMGEVFVPQIKIGDNVSFNVNCHVASINKVIIGNDVLFGSNVFITDHSHGMTDVETLNISPTKRRLYSKGCVVIEDRVWVGENVAILPGVTIGRNSVVGANSVVTKSIPAFSVAAGIPAIILKTAK